jgi:phage gpG-like protein
MATVEFKGLGSNDVNKPGTFAHAIARMIRRGGNYQDVLEDIGRQSVTRTTEKIAKNEVKPKTKRVTLLARRHRKKRPSTSGITLLDTGIGIKQVSHRVGINEVTIGVPRGYMAAHQKGTVPNAPRRRFLTMLTKREILRVINFHWKKAIR